jgi:hypothetical protein
MERFQPWTSHWATYDWTMQQGCASSWACLLTPGRSVGNEQGVDPPTLCNQIDGGKALAWAAKGSLRVKQWTSHVPIGPTLRAAVHDPRRFISVQPPLLVM